MSGTLLAEISSATILAKNNLQRFYNKIGDLAIDATTSEVIEQSTTITSHPVSSGFTISDHAFLNPVLVKLEGLITDGALYLSDINTLAGFFQGNIVSNILDYATGPSKKQILAFNLLETLRANRTLVTVVTRMKTYKNLIIESLVFNKEKDIGDVLSFKITLKEIKIVANKTINIKPPIISTNLAGAANLYDVGKAEVTEVVGEKKTELLKDFQKLKNFFN